MLSEAGFDAMQAFLTRLATPHVTRPQENSPTEANAARRNWAASLAAQGARLT
jgi:hypothetical protein